MNTRLTSYDADESNKKVIMTLRLKDIILNPENYGNPTDLDAVSVCVCVCRTHTHVKHIENLIKKTMPKLPDLA